MFQFHINYTLGIGVKNEGSPIFEPFQYVLSYDVYTSVMTLEKALYLIYGRGFNKTVCKMATARTYSESSDEEYFSAEEESR